MNRKRDKPYLSRHPPYSFPKRRRPPPPPPPPPPVEDIPPPPENVAASTKTSTAVLVIGLSLDCSVLDLKSRFEIYGPISRTRMDPGGVAYITFRSKDAADSAVSAALDPSFGITLNSNRVQVMLASDPVPQWREGIGYKEVSTSAASKLVRAEVPLSRQGRRGNKLGSAIVNPRNDDEDNSRSNNNNGGSLLDLPFKGREIVAYDDIL